MTNPVDHTELRALLPYATETQAKYIAAVIEHGSATLAEAALDVRRDTVSAGIRSLRNRAARLGYAPDHFVGGVAPGYLMGKVTVQRGPTGVERTWERQSPDQEQVRAAMQAAAEAMAEELPRLRPILPEVQVLGKLWNPKLLNLYTLTDAHVGMLAWHREGGENWDLDIAESVLVKCFQAMIDASPPARIAVVNQLGDFLHSDGMLPITPTSGNILDQDGRFSKLVKVAIRVLRKVIDLALQHHETVKVVIAEGNHDMASSIWLRHMFKALYENEPRVEVVDSELPYYAIEHGATMLGFHHGHLKKPDLLTPVMAAQFAPIWGRTKYRYAHMGHQHHYYEKEHNGMTVAQHPTLASRDAYASRGGWFAARATNAVTYHSEYGQVARYTVTPEMVS